MTIVTWRKEIITPGLTLDESYATGLEWMGSTGRVAGRDLVFNYGPWGWVNFPRTVDPSHAIVAAFVQIVILLVLSAIVVVTLERKGYRFFYAAPIAVVALGVANLLSSSDAAVVALFIAGVALLGGPRHCERWAIGYSGAVGFMATALVFTKFDAGIRACAAVLLAGAFAVRSTEDTQHLRRVARSAYALTIGSGLVLIAMFLSLGFSNLMLFTRGSVDLVTGFPAAMGVESNPAWEYPLAMLVAAGVGALTWWQLRNEERVVKVLATIGVVGFIWLLGKSGFTRHDGHSMSYFASMTVLAVVLLPCAVRLPLRLASCVFATLTALAATQAIAASPVQSLIDAPRGVNSFATYLSLIHPASGWSDINHGAAKRILSAMPANVLAAADGKTVHIEPSLTAIAWALAEDGHATLWRPIPTMQSYNGYTPYLDDLNAAYLASESAPTVIIRTEDFGNLAIQWESPAYKQQLFCWYQPVVTEHGWQALDRRPASICGQPSPSTAARSRPNPAGGHVVGVPAAADNEMLVAQFSGGPIDSTPTALALVAKPFSDNVSFDPNRPAATAFAFDDNLAAQIHVVSYPACWRRTGTVDPTEAHEIRFDGGFRPPSQSDMVVTFRAIPTECPR